VHLQDFVPDPLGIWQCFGCHTADCVPNFLTPVVRWPDAEWEVGGSTPGLSHGDLGILPRGRPKQRKMPKVAGVYPHRFVGTSSKSLSLVQDVKDTSQILVGGCLHCSPKVQVCKAPHQRFYVHCRYPQQPIVPPQEFTHFRNNWCHWLLHSRRLARRNNGSSKVSCENGDPSPQSCFGQYPNPKEYKG
jgi:hypothetical protein